MKILYTSKYRRIIIRDREIYLTKCENELFSLLYKNEIATLDEIVERMATPARMTIGRLRRYGINIKTIHGIGYKLLDTVQELGDRKNEVVEMAIKPFDPILF